MRCLLATRKANLAIVLTTQRCVTGNLLFSINSCKSRDFSYPLIGVAPSSEIEKTLFTVLSWKKVPNIMN